MIAVSKIGFNNHTLGSNIPHCILPCISSDRAYTILRDVLLLSVQLLIETNEIQCE